MFIPFFSTKPSGSDLSISRQMLMMQSINLSLAEHNVAGYHVTFRLNSCDIVPSLCTML